MFKIGEFSRFSRVSVKMLRHYDEIGLLKPAGVDPFTKYRYYSAGQLSRLNRILALKDLGFSLEQIKTLLDEELPAGQIRGMLKLRQAEIQERLQTEEIRLARVESRLRQIEQAEQMPPYDVVLRSIEPQLVAALRQVVQLPSTEVTEMFEALEACVAQHKARAALPPLLLYHDVEYRPGRQDIEVAVPLTDTFAVTGRVAIRELPGHEQVACVVHTGRYNSLPSALSTLLTWLERHQYEASGPIREVYLRFGAAQEGYTLPDAFLATAAAEFVTELQVPVTRQSEN